jgi:hypothetical protein
MSVNAGIAYERQLFTQLKLKGYIPKDIHKPEQIPGQDLTIVNSIGQTSGIEVKYADGNKFPSFGSGTLKFNFARSYVFDNPWEFAEITADLNDKQVMQSIASNYNLRGIVNQNWFENNNRYIPYLIDQHFTKAAKAKGLSIPSRNEAYKEDKKNLTEIKKIPCKISDILAYYNSKGSYYIQISGHGLFWLGKEDPLNISNNIPMFSAEDAYFRVRVQPKSGSGDSVTSYNFAYELNISKFTAGISNYNLERNLKFLIAT